MERTNGEVGSAGRSPWLARCPGCGYDLRGLGIEGSGDQGIKSGLLVCPECGWTATEEERERLRRRERFGENGAPLAELLLMVLGVYIAIIQTVAQVRAGGDAITMLAGVFRAELVPLIGIALGFGASRPAPKGERGACFVMWCQTMAWLMLPLLVTLPMLRFFEGRSLAVVPGLAVFLALVGFSGWVIHATWLTRRHVIEPGGAFFPITLAAFVVVGLSMWPAVVVQMMIWASV